MPLPVVLAFVAAAVGAAIALVTLRPASRAAWRYPLAGGMLTLAAEVAAGALGVRSTDPEMAREWWEASLTCGALVPGPWLAFSLSFARVDAGALLRRSWWLLGGLLVVPLGLVSFRQDLLGPGSEGSSYFPLGWAGYGLGIVQILAAVLVLANLEKTLRASTGSQRWLIKFVVIGVCTLFALRVYLSSQALLFRALDTRLLVVSAVGLLLAELSILLAYARTRLQTTDVYLSSTALYGSFTTLLVAGYLLAVGLLAAAAGRAGGAAALPLVTLVLLGAFWLLAVVVLSDEARHRLRLLVSRHFRRPLYDYRLEWRRFTERTGSTLDARELCSGVAAWIADTVKLPAVSVWLVEESGAAALGGSTLRSPDAPGTAGAVAAIIRVLGERTEPVDLSTLDLPELQPQAPEDMRFATLLRAGHQTVGLITHSERATGDALTAEDLELLKTAGEQAASRLLGVRLSERLARAREMEAFQSLSAFFVHDLKNLASRLSLSLHNLPERIEDPEFRADLVATLSRVVTRIEEMTGRLSQVARRLELKVRLEDLSEIVGAALDGLEGSLKGRLERKLGPVPPVPCDGEQMEKVIVNLVLNADQALGDGGTITVSTGSAGADVLLTVADDGCGMSPEFVATSLFQPFKSSKAKGLGIGLFHTRKIVEAHGGRIEVETGPGRGSTFTVRLPRPPA
jgi:putative PEP-CTERM system histidine kinase